MVLANPSHMCHTAAKQPQVRTYVYSRVCDIAGVCAIQQPNSHRCAHTYTAMCAI